MVKARPGSIAAASHVPLADKGRLVAGPLKKLGEEDRSRRREIIVVHNVMMVHEQPGQNGGSARRAERCGHKGAGEVGSARRERVEAGSFQKGMVKKTDGIVAMVIGQNEDNVPGARPLDLFQLEAALLLLAECRGWQQS